MIELLKQLGLLDVAIFFALITVAVSVGYVYFKLFWHVFELAAKANAEGELR